MKGRRLLGLLGSATLLCAAVSAMAQTEAFPNRPIRIVPFGVSGGVIDGIARMYGEKLRERWKQPVILEAKPGASGTIAADFVAKAPPDGHTILFTLSLTHINNAILQKSIPYDPVKDFEPLTQLATGGPAIIAPANAPFNDVRELVAYAKTRPEGITYGTWGTGSGAHLMGELLARQSGARLVHVPYKAEAAAHLDMFGGSLDFAWANPGSARNHLRSGKIKVIGLTGTRRLQVLPGVQLLGEQGWKGFDLDSWTAVYAPARTPKAIVEELSAAFREATRAPDIVARWIDLGFEPLGNSPEDFARNYKADFPKWVEIIKAAGVTPE
jgi:tripartite-type tricarboxylate transporter receptor subunit TctC